MQPRNITIAGKINDGKFEQCRICAKEIGLKRPELNFYIVPLFEVQFQQYIKNLGQVKSGKFALHQKSPIIFEGQDNYIGGRNEFLDWAKNYAKYIDNSKEIIYELKSKLNLKNITKMSNERIYCFFYVKYGQNDIGTLVFELFKDIAPKTCENFIQLCLLNYTNSQGFLVSYLGSIFNRVVPGSFIQGGIIDILGPKSIYKGEFADETFKVMHDQIGILGMAKRECIKHTNECQFYITLRDKLSTFDGKYVAFGRLISGLRILKLIETEGISDEKPCVIVGCGIYQYMVDLPSIEDFAIKYENIKEKNKEIKRQLKNLNKDDQNQNQSKKNKKKRKDKDKKKEIVNENEKEKDKNKNLEEIRDEKNAEKTKDQKEKDKKKKNKNKKLDQEKVTFNQLSKEEKQDIQRKKKDEKSGKKEQNDPSIKDTNTFLEEPQTIDTKTINSNLIDTKLEKNGTNTDKTNIPKKNIQIIKKAKEIISIFVGQAGCQIGNSFWKQFALENDITLEGKIKEDSQRELNDTFFELGQQNRIYPRAIFIDTDPTIINQIKKGILKNFYNMDNFYSLKEDSGGIFSRAEFTLSGQLRSLYEEPLRKICEHCDQLQGSTFFHSIGGGTGGGMTQNIANSLHSVGKISKLGFSVFPSPKLSFSTVEPINSYLSITSLLEHFDLDFIFENDSLYDICSTFPQTVGNSFDNINTIIGLMVSSIYSCFGQEDANCKTLSELINHLAPTPKKHFIINSYSPLEGKGKNTLKKNMPLKTFQLIDQYSKQFTKCDLQIGNCLSSSIIGRGEISNLDIKTISSSIHSSNFSCVNKNKNFFYFNNNRLPILSNLGFENSNFSFCNLMNHSSVAQLFENLNNKFQVMFAKRPFIHWYVGEGFSESGYFGEPSHMAQEIIAEYSEVS